MFPGFELTRIATSGAEIVLRHGGSGPPLLLIHGNPLTHVSWHKVAPRLARDFTVVAPDLRGYGDSSKPPGGPDHAAYSFRAMGEDMVEAMAALGHERFFLAGHDRGARVGHRLCLDRPEKVLAFSSLDIVPTHYLLSHISKGWAQESYHWFFMAQKAPFPEDLLCRDLAYYMRYKLDKKGVGLSPFTPEAMAEYVRCCTPETVHAVCEDYRATLGIDYDMDAADLGRKFIDCPLQVIWGENSHVGRHLNVQEAWSPWARGPVDWRPLPCGHYPAEQVPDLVHDAFMDFFAGAERRPARPEAR